MMGGWGVKLANVTKPVLAREQSGPGPTTEVRKTGLRKGRRFKRQSRIYGR